MRKQTSGLFVAVAVTFSATVGVREGHALPAPGWVPGAEGYVERSYTPKEGLLSQVVRVNRMNDTCGVLYQDCDWGVTLRPPVCTGTRLGHDCEQDRKRFIEFFWSGSKREWRADAAMHMFAPLSKKLKGAAGYQDCNFEAGMGAGIDKAKYRKVLQGVQDAAGSEWGLGAGINRYEAYRGLVANMVKDPGLEGYVKAMWQEALTSTPAFTCWWNNTSGTTNFVPDGEVTLTHLSQKLERSQRPIANTMFRDCEKDGGEGLCGQDILVHGLYVWDENHGTFGGKPELHPIHAMTSGWQHEFESQVRFAVFTDSGKAGGGGSGHLAGYIEDITPGAEWYTLDDQVSKLPPKPKEGNTTFVGRCDFEWTSAYPSWERHPFTYSASGVEPKFKPGKNDCREMGDLSLVPTVKEYNLKGGSWWMGGWVTGTIRRRWERAGFTVTHSAPVVSEVTKEGQARRFNVKLRAEVRTDSSIIPSPIFQFRTGGISAEDFDSVGLKPNLFEVTTNLLAINPADGYQRKAELWLLSPTSAMDGSKISETYFELPRPEVSIEVTNRRWFVSSGSSTNLACAKEGIPKGSGAFYEATLVAKPTGIAGKATFEWKRPTGNNAFEKLPSTGDRITVPIHQEIYHVLAKDGIAGGPFETATAVTHLSAPDPESVLATNTSSSGAKGAPVPVASVLPVPAQGQCNKISSYSVTTRPITRLVPDWAFEDMGYRDAKGKSLVRPFCAQFAWQALQTRALPDGAWTDVVVRPNEAKASSDGAVRAWSDGDGLVVKTSDGKAREFRLLLSARDSLGRRAEKAVAFDNWEIEGEGGNAGFGKAVSECSREFIKKFNPKLIAAVPMLDLFKLKNGGVTDPAGGPMQGGKFKSHGKTHELLQFMQSGQPPH